MAERPRLAGARLPEPPEARLLDRVLQCVPPVSPASAGAATRILIVDNGVAGLYGGYLNGIIRPSTPTSLARPGVRDVLRQI